MLTTPMGSINLWLLVFGKSITQPPKPPTRHVAAMPSLPWRAFLLGIIAIVGSAYAIVRHYAITHAQDAPVEREIPAPEVVPLER